jgi:hypothetical protein
MQFILLGKDKRYNFDIVSRLLDKITLKKPSEFHSYTSGKAFIEPKPKIFWCYKLENLIPLKISF